MRRSISRGGRKARRRNPAVAAAWRALAVAAGVLTGVASFWHGASADSFNNVTNALLQDNCANLIGGSNAESVSNDIGQLNSLFGPQLSNLCLNPVPPVGFPPAAPGFGGASGGGQGGSATTNASLSVFERMRTAREAESEESGYTHIASAEKAMSVERVGAGFSLWFSAGAEALSHRNNEFEDGYSSTVPTVTVGGDYRFNDWLVGGLAVNYTNLNGNYDDGGRLNTNGYGPIVYATLTPIEGAFADVVFSYARQNNYRRRVAAFNQTVTNLNNPAVTFDKNVSGNASADYDGDNYNFSTLLGYDYPIDNVTIGPRLGVNVTQYSVDSFSEDGSTGIEVAYSGMDRTSVQTLLGATATVAISVPFGVILPQVSASWVHEHAFDQRNVTGRFVQDNRPDPTRFKFQYESPDRNYALIRAGVSALLPHNIQPFAEFSTIQGNDNLVSYGGTAGLRIDL